MYGENRRSFLPVLVLSLNHLFAVATVIWLLFGGGIEFFGNTFGYGWASGDYWRRILIALCSAVYFLRVIFTSFVLLKRKMAWGECLTIVIWLYAIHTALALLGGTRAGPIGIIEIVGTLLYLFGSYLNTGSEYSRKIWKEKTENIGKLYTKRLFRYSMHINYFGDFVLFAGFAIVTKNPFSFVIPVLMAIFFITINIPMLDKYLVVKYGKEFEDYSRITKKFIPFIY